uniref:RNA-directed RNA polymerase catalytic subunit n=1 Tax=Wuhan Mosquito Virus 7 TaxID=1608132 RepID=A0A0B5KK02_9ORTO|nr:PB1 [Wuhan Mosquito Virus 7]
MVNPAWLKEDVGRGLHMLNATYLYTNPPPYGHGSPGPYVYKTVQRAYDFAVRPDGHIKYQEILGYETVDSAIHEIEDFPKEGTTGLFHPGTVRAYVRSFMSKYGLKIDEAAEETMREVRTSNIDVLSKGRQTWDPFLKRSTTCAKAYNTFIDLIEKNLGKCPVTWLEGLLMWFELYNLERLVYITTKEVVVKRQKYNPKLKRVVTKYITKRRAVWKTATGDNVRRRLDDYARSFCSYIKHAERGKMDRRAIASPSIPLRMLLKIVEEFHLKLGKKIPGSTISIGGEEKKRKIITELASIADDQMVSTTSEVQGTEDAKKWNECLNPKLFYMVHELFFNDKLRGELGLPPANGELRALANLCSITFFYMLIKRIHMGAGPLLVNEDFYTRKQWHQIKLEEMSPYNQEWFRGCMALMDDEDYLKSSPGFLMGMLNAASTTIGLLLPLGYVSNTSWVKCLRSSDDSMTVFSATGPKELGMLIDYIYHCYRLFGINPSKEKNMIFKVGFGEYTSWYHDGNFVSQYGVETSSLKPGGQNPQDDIDSAMALTLTQLRTFLINPFGAIIRIILSAENVRRLWNIRRVDRPNLSAGVQFFADGGDCPWNMELLATHECAIRLSNVKTEEDKRYVAQVMNPNNPFSEEPMESIMYSRDSGKMAITVADTPRNIFNTVRRSNRTARTEQSEDDAAKEKANKEAYEIAMMVNPSFHIKIPSSRSKLSEALSGYLAMEAGNETFTPEEMMELEQAMNRLDGVTEEDNERWEAIEADDD